MDKSYWKKYYQNIVQSACKLPSQFAIFTLNELLNTYNYRQANSIIIEVGCGDGTDANYFASVGYDVLAFDQTIDGVCYPETKKLKYIGINNFIELQSHITNLPIANRNLIIYNRFFLHAISEDEENTLLHSLDQALGDGDLFVTEFRTVADMNRIKVTDRHYRRFQLLEDMLQKLSDHNYTALYSCEGRGMAKYKTDDAVVGRIIAIKNAN